MLRLAALAAVLATSACIVPIGIPSARIDGGFSTAGAGSIRAGTHVVGYRRDPDAKWDVGAGYTRTATTFDPMALVANGFYLEGSYLHRLDGPARLSIGPGISMLFRGEDNDLVPVVYLRAGIEMFTPVRSSGTSDGKCGITTGTWWGQAGLGAFVDVQKPATEPGLAVVAGLTGRLPTFAGVAIVIPYCR